VARPSNTRERRAQIVDALLTVMARSGYDGASIQAIAKEAGLAPGLLHYHFESKQEILRELVETLAAQLRERYRRRLDDAGEAPGARLRAFVEAHLAEGPDADARAVASWVLIAAEAVREPEVRALYGASVGERLAELEGLLRACIAGAGKRARGVRALAAAGMAAIEGAYLLSASTDRVMPAGYAAGALVAMLEGGVAGLPGTS
jgi:TetR/AcrR family transcriptional regulator, transcriptional repressor of bet genes